MYVCNACVYVMQCVHVSVRMQVLYVWCMHECMNACMQVCMYVCVCVMHAFMQASDVRTQCVHAIVDVLSGHVMRCNAMRFDAA